MTYDLQPTTNLHRQAFSSLGPAAVDDLAAVGGAHAYQETVGSFSFRAIGLIGPAHVIFPPFTSSR